MKLYLFLFSLYLGLDANCQTVRYEISVNGLDSIKIGMSINEVEKIVSAKLQPYILPDSILKSLDSSQISSGNKNPGSMYQCQYKTIPLLLTFFRHTMYTQSDFELVGICPLEPSPLIQNKAGIKTGISENKFLSICKKSHYPYSEMGGKNDKAYFFSDDPNKKPAQMLMAKFSEGKLEILMIVNMIGD